MYIDLFYSHSECQVPENLEEEYEITDVIYYDSGNTQNQYRCSYKEENEEENRKKIAEHNQECYPSPPPFPSPKPNPNQA